MPPTRLDMHCHSRASREPVSRLLGVLGISECYSEPERVYDTAKDRGMDLVTITDHDSIDGVMSLVERGYPDLIVGEEVTVCFPEDRCRLHVLVWGHTPSQHEELARLGIRDDVYRFADWLHSHQLAHALAHPFYSQNGKLTPGHLERCVLMFKGWESLNGAHASAHNSALERFLGALTPARVQRLERRHAMRALWVRPWDKARTAGSDDHALLNLGRTWTELPASPAQGGGSGAGAAQARGDEFLRRIMSGAGVPGGRAGSPTALADQIIAVGVQHYTRRAGPRAGRTGSTRQPSLAGVMEALTGAMENPGELSAFVDDLSGALAHAGASGLFRTDGGAGSAGEDLPRALLAMGLSVAAQLPGVCALFQQNKDRALVSALERCDGPDDSAAGRSARVCLFTDTLADINGVSRFIADMSGRAGRAGHELHVLTSTPGPVAGRPNVDNLAPVFHTDMPAYPGLTLSLPPLLRMLRRVEELRPDAVHVSTPGPVGLVGVVAASMLRVPLVGVYHTDFPAYIDSLFDDASLTSLCRWWLRVFYSGPLGLRPFDCVLARSRSCAASMRSLGIPSQRIRVLPPGIDTERFSPAFRDASVWSRVERGDSRLAGLSRPGVKVLYVGRLSAEKNAALLARAWRRVSERCIRAGTPADLVIVGDGPARGAMEQSLRGAHAHFLGVRRADELSSLYASSDLFIFPSVTDTLGQAVMEAQASGVPAIVSDRGGPRESVARGATGLIVRTNGAGDERRWARAILSLIQDARRRSAMSQAASEAMRHRDLSGTFTAFWGAHGQARPARARRSGVDAKSDRETTVDGPGSARVSAPGAPLR